MTIKEQLFEIYHNDDSKNGLYNTLKLIGITQKNEEAKRFLAEYNVWRQKKESKIKVDVGNGIRANINVEDLAKLDLIR